MDELVGRTAVVTGAASGIGRALAGRFATAGMNLVLADVEEPALASAGEELVADGARVLTVPTDVRRAADVEALLEASLAEFGRVNVLCNNAGVAGPFGLSVEELAVEDWEWVLGVDLWGVIHGTRVFVPHLLSHGDGHVVNTASLAGLTTGAVINAAYHVAKHGVVALSECLYHDLAARGSTVGVTVLCPGFVPTRINEDVRNRPEELMPARAWREPTQKEEEVRAAMREMSAAGRPPEEVADLVHDAILEGRFYVHTDEAAMPFIRSRHEAIQSASNPAPGELD